jgi:pyruvate/oxaloacetate carboxyltransferase
MSSFICEYCGVSIIDTEHGYISWCEHYPQESTIYIYRYRTKAYTGTLITRQSSIKNVERDLRVRYSDFIEVMRYEPNISTIFEKAGIKLARANAREPQG